MLYYTPRIMTGLELLYWAHSLPCAGKYHPPAVSVSCFSSPFWFARQPHQRYTFAVVYNIYLHGCHAPPPASQQALALWRRPYSSSLSSRHATKVPTETLAAIHFQERERGSVCTPCKDTLCHFSISQWVHQSPAALMACFRVWYPVFPFSG